MAVFMGLYEGQTIGSAEVVGISADPVLVRFAATRMLAELMAEPAVEKSVRGPLTEGRAEVLRQIIAQCEEAATLRRGWPRRGDSQEYGGTPPG
jgi:hypothetical protein